MKLRYSLMLGALLILAGTSCEDKLDITSKRCIGLFHLL